MMCTKATGVPFYSDGLSYIAYSAWYESRINGETVVYMELFESVWRDRAENAGWKIDFVYKDEYTTLIFNRGLTDRTNGT